MSLMARWECQEGKKEAPAIDEGEEARLCGGLWTSLNIRILAGPDAQVNHNSKFFAEKLCRCRLTDLTVQTELCPSDRLWPAGMY
jgi:hypothetical protein